MKTYCKVGTVSLLSLILLTNFKCSKDSTDSFCAAERTTYMVLDKKEGMVVYSTKVNRYGISLSANTSNNIDSQVIGYVCNLPQDIKGIGTKVIVSGILKNFNNNENIKPEIAGQSLYYLEISQLTK